ncbi:MAG: hypothetical protein R3C49_20505 [Planctomycetaceae bacterium]
MENHFAGAQDLHNRRRRWLSTCESDPDSDELAELISNPSRSTLPFSRQYPHSSQLLRRLISPRLWKHVCLLTVLTAAVTGVIYWQQNPQQGDAGSTQRLSLAVGVGLTGLMQLAAGQLSFLVGWIRSRSEVDFRGRYRSWKWLAVLLMLSGILSLTGLNHQASAGALKAVETMTGPLQAARPAVLLIPMILAVLFVTLRILPDMNRNRWSQSLLAAATAVAAIRILLPHTPLQSSISERLPGMLDLATSGVAVFALTLHCRFVAFVCHDPPEISVNSPLVAGNAETQTAATVSVLPFNELEASEQVAALAISDDTEPVPEDSPTSTRRKSPSKPKRQTRKTSTRKKTDKAA